FTNRTALAVNPVDGHVFASTSGGNSLDEYDAEGVLVAVYTDPDELDGTHHQLDQIAIAKTQGGVGELVGIDQAIVVVSRYTLPFGTLTTRLGTVALPFAKGVFVGPANIAYTPNAPAHAVAAAGQGQATVTFDPPAADPSGLAITSYIVTARANIGGTVSAAGSQSPITVTGLTNDHVSYTFTVAAVNANGSGALSAASNSVTPTSTVPAAPTSVTAAAGDGQASVSFTPPTDTGGLTIDRYDVVSSPASAGASGTGSPIVVSGLTNGIHYTFTVAAHNSVGEGAASAPSNDVQPTGAPQPPSIVSATAGDQQVSVAFDPPANDGGSPITSYTATSSPGGFTATGGASPLVVAGLTDLTAYTFTVTATNALGTSLPSSASLPATPFLAPGAPSAVSAAVIASGTMHVTCIAGTPGDSPVTSFTATSSPGGLVGTSAGNTCDIVVRGLTAGTRYSFTVVANTQLGSGAASTPSTAALMPDAPGAPTSVVATLLDATTVSLAFSPPASDGGSAILFYNVRANSSPTPVVSTASEPVPVTGLTPGTAYTFTVSAVNLAGEGPQSAASAS